MRADNWGTFHPSVFIEAGRLLHWAAATRRAQGAVSYRCPVTVSFMLVTEAAKLKKLA